MIVFKILDLLEFTDVTHNFHFSFFLFSFFNIKFKSYLVIQSINISIGSFSFLTECCLSGCRHQMKSCIGYWQGKKKKKCMKHFSFFHCPKVLCQGRCSNSHIPENQQCILQNLYMYRKLLT